MSVEPNTDVSEFVEFLDSLRGQRAESERVVRHGLRRVRSAVLRSASPGTISEWPATLLPRGAAASIKCRMRIRAVSASSVQETRTLFWNILEETDEDLF